MMVVHYLCRWHTTCDGGTLPVMIGTLPVMIGTLPVMVVHYLCNGTQLHYL